MCRGNIETPFIPYGTCHTCFGRETTLPPVSEGIFSVLPNFSAYQCLICGCAIGAQTIVK